MKTLLVFYANLYKTAIFSMLVLALTSCTDRALGEKQGATENAPTERTPDIILILFDDLGWSDIGVYGSEIQTPNLDRLALNGVRFSRFYTTSKCFPSRAALLTGYYPQQINRAVDPKTPMLSEVAVSSTLRAYGYATFMVGKHHGIENPVDYGFDRYKGLRDGAANHFNPGTAARIGEPKPARKMAKGRVWCFDLDCRAGYAPTKPDFYSSDAYTDWSLELMDKAITDDQPYFLYLSYTAPHDHLQAPANVIKAYKSQYDDGYAAVREARFLRQKELGLLGEDITLPPAIAPSWLSLDPALRADQTQRMEVYAAMIHRLDQNVGRILNVLKAEGRLENTLIIVTSDNGGSAEQVFDTHTGLEIGATHEIGSVGRWASLGPGWAEVSNTPFRYYKNYSHNGGVLAPFIVHWPAGIRQDGAIIGSPRHLIDIHPTLLGVVSRFSKRKPPRFSTPLPGIDLSTQFNSEDSLPRNTPLFNHWRDGRFVVMGQWKLVSYGRSKNGKMPQWELYDVVRDPAESQNIAAENASIVASLEAAYLVWEEGHTKMLLKRGVEP